MNIVKNTQIKTTIRLQEWGPLNGCSIPPLVTFWLSCFVMMNKQKYALLWLYRKKKVFSTMAKDDISIDLMVALNTSVRTGT